MSVVQTKPTVRFKLNGSRLAADDLDLRVTPEPVVPGPKLLSVPSEPTDFAPVAVSDVLAKLSYCRLAEPELPRLEYELSAPSPDADSCSAVDFFNQSEVPHDVRESEFAEWSARNKLEHADRIKAAQASGTLWPIRDSIGPSRWPTRAERLAGVNPVDETPKLLPDYYRKHWHYRLLSVFPAASNSPETDAHGGGGAPWGVPTPGAAVQGLSNAPYLPVSTQPVIELEIRPASAKFRARPSRIPNKRTSGGSVTGGYESGHTLTKRPAKRGAIHEFSDRSRLGLQLLAADLQQIVHKPDLMVTLTYPGEWRSVCQHKECTCGASKLPDYLANLFPCSCSARVSGKACKRHLDTFQKRVTRYLTRFGVVGWGCLWFLEFQRRGAPHFHLLFFGLNGVRAKFPLELLKRWCSRAWSEIVNHADNVERQKHLNAGTRVEHYRAAHFGYAVKYAAKLVQKSVPADFSDIGRFWGCWNKPEIPVVRRSFSPTPDDLKNMGLAVYALLSPYSKRFADRFSGACHAAADGGYAFSMRLFGRPSADYLAAVPGG